MATPKRAFALLVAMAILMFFLTNIIPLYQHPFKPHQIHIQGIDLHTPLIVKPWLQHFSTTSRADKQKDHLVISIAISNKGKIVLFTTGFLRDRGNVASCTVNGRTLSGKRIDRDIFECEKGSSLHEDDVLSIKLSDGTIVPSLAVWSDRTPLSIGDHPKIHVCITTMMKNESGKIADWVEYHIRQGVELFLVYNNNSTDNTLSELQKYPQVVVVDWPGKKTQPAAILHAFLHMKEVCEWVFDIDVDEYIFPVAGNGSFTVKELMYEFPKWVNSSKNVPNAAAIDQVCMDAKLMGSSGYIHCPNLPVTEAYIHLNRWRSWTCKCAARPKHVLGKHMWPHFHDVGGKTVRLLRNTAHLVHYKYQCWDYFVTKYYKGRSSPKKDWDINEIEMTQRWSNASGPLDTAFRDYKRHVDKWPLL